jgi:hypothetical protein
MGSNILAGATLIGGQGAGELSQYYGAASTAQTTVTATTLTALSAVCTIPASEAYQDAAYQLDCGGTIVWGTASEHLQLSAYLNSTALHDTVTIDDSVFASGSVQAFKASLNIVCADGVSEWLGSWTFTANQLVNHIIPGTAANNTVTASDSAPGAISVPVSAPITVAMMASWTGAVGSPEIVNDWTLFRKVA